MTIDLVRQLLDSCFTGKKITEMMPPLPQGIKPRHIHLIEAVGLGAGEGRPVRPTDISRSWHVTKPSIVRLVRELEDMGVLSASRGGSDRRTTELHLTEKGQQYYDLYVDQYHRTLQQQLEDLDEEDCRRAVRLWQRLYQKMKEMAEHE